MQTTPETDDFDTPSLSESQQAKLKDLIDQYELARDAGAPVSPEELCRNEPALLQPLVNSLLRLSFVDVRLLSVPTLPIPERIGEFTVVKPLGAGATGIVFRCRQHNPSRDVAIKVLKPLLNATKQQRRFQREMAAISAIHEPGMAEVYQSGIVDWCSVGCFWIAMELLDGGDVCKYTRTRACDQQHVLTIFRTICQTLRAAHRLGILHRDIKPSNILMSKDGQPHLVDFGIAKLPGSMHDGKKTETEHVSAKGTAAWMAPELLLADSVSVGDVRSEIFALGVVLFEMLTGQHPFGAERLSVPQISARMAQRTQTSLAKVLPTASPDLVSFTSKLMAFDVDHRYQNLDDVLSDLTLLENGDPVKGRIVPAWEQTIRWCRRQWKSATILGIVATAAVSVVATIWMASLRLESQAELLQDRNRELAAQTQQLQMQTVDLENAIRLQQRSIGNGILRSLQYSVARSPVTVRRTLHDSAQFPIERHGFAWELLNHESTIEHRSFPKATGDVRQLNFSADGKRLTTVAADGLVSIFDLDTGVASTGRSLVKAAAPVFRGETDSTLFAISESNSLIELDGRSGNVVQDFHETRGLQPRYAVSEDGSQAIGVRQDRTPFLLDLHSRELRTLPVQLAKSPCGLWFSEQGTVVSLVDQSGLWQQWSVMDLQLIQSESLMDLVPGLHRISLVEFSSRTADGSRIAIAQANGMIHILPAESNSPKPKIRIELHGERVRQMMFLSPFHLVTVGHSVRMHHLFQTEAPNLIPASEQDAMSVAMTDDGQTLAVGGTDGSVTIVGRHAPTIERFSVSPFDGLREGDFGAPRSLLNIPGSQIIIGQTGGWVANVNSVSGKTAEGFFSGNDGPVNSLDLHPSEPMVAMGIGGNLPGVKVFRLREGTRLCEETKEILCDCPQPEFSLTTKADVRVVHFTPDGQHLLVAFRNGAVWKLNCSSWTTESRWSLHDGGVFAMSVRADRFATGGNDGLIRLSLTADGTADKLWRAHSARIMAVLFSPDGARIYSASHDGTIRIWSNEGRLLHSLNAHVGAVLTLELSPDGQTLVSGGHDRRILLWDAESGDLQREILGHSDHLSDLKFTENGRALISSGLDGTVRVWSPDGPH